MTKHFIFGNQNLDVEIALKIKLQITFSLNFSSGYYMSLPRKLTIYANVFRLILIYIYIFMTLQFTNGIKVLVKYMKTLPWLDNLCNIICLFT